jgi:hypothetical protein
VGPDIEVRCVKCRQVGPDVNCGGFLGTPSLELDEKGPLGPSFWFYYEPLCLIGLRPFELDRFYNWLMLHARHPVYPVGGVVDNPMGVPHRVLYWDEQEVEAERGFTTEYEGPTPDKYVWARYELMCVTCRVACEAQQPEWLFRSNDLVLTDEGPELFLDRWGDAEGVYAMGLSPLVDPYDEFQDRLRAFLGTHRYTPRRGLRPASDHTLQVRLVAAPPAGDTSDPRMGA